MTESSNIETFQLTTPIPRRVALSIALLGAIAAIVPLLLFSIGVVDITTALLFSCMGAGIAGVLVWRIYVMTHGTVLVRDDALVVKTSDGKEQYNWHHISDVSMRTKSAEGAGGNLPQVELTLSQTARIQVLSGEITSGGFGIPVGTKSIRLAVDRPERLFTLVQSLIRVTGRDNGGSGL